MMEDAEDGQVCDARAQAQAEAQAEDQEPDLPPSASAPLAPGLYLVATPIGNLEDVTLRALRVLANADLIACEDTRQTRKLLTHFAIRTAMISFHEHNERARSEEILALLRQGRRVAIVSDAGMPGISDPGMYLARAAIEEGFPVIPVPGANAALSALVASGLGTGQFLFAGFLPSKAGERRTQLSELPSRVPLGGRLTVIFYEAPHRILDALADIRALWGDTVRVVAAREITKRHEEFLRGTPAEVYSVLSGRERVRGEIVLLIEMQGASAPAGDAGQSASARVMELMEKDGLDKKEALKRVARERGLSKSSVYRELQQAGKAPPSK